MRLSVVPHDETHPMRLACLTLGLMLLSALPANAAEPLHQQIDRLIVAQAKGKLAPRSGDAEFLRRVYLDLAGRIPSSAEARAFLSDTASDKRARLIDRLLDSDDYARHMRELFHVMLMERRGDDAEWNRFLRTAFEQNLPWDQIVQSILKPDPEDEHKRGAAFFYTKRLVKEGAFAEVDVPGLTRDVGRLFAGVDLQCAQCHDHMFVDDYKQRSFQGLHAFFTNLQTRRDVKFPAVAEKLMKEKADYMSVFVQEPMKTAPVVPGFGEIEIPSFKEGEEYLVPPDRKKRTPGVPKFSPLDELANRLASEQNEVFCQNIANRMWFVMMGRGLVDPLDLRHAENPPSHPELLKKLGQQFAAHRFDLKWLLKELALSETYQRTSVLPAGQEPPAPEAHAVALEKRISAEQLFWSVLYATGELPAGMKDGKLSDKHKQLLGLFVYAFANAVKEPEVDFAPSVKAALFALNNDKLLDLFQRRDGNLVDRLAKLSDDSAVCDELFLSVLSRRPEEAERQRVSAYLSQHAERREEALGQLAWALVASTEFCINH